MYLGNLTYQSSIPLNLTYSLLTQVGIVLKLCSTTTCIGVDRLGLIPCKRTPRESSRRTPHPGTSGLDIWVR